MTDFTNLPDAAAIIESTEELTLAAARLEEIDAVTYGNVFSTVLKNGDQWLLKIEDLERFAETPRRKVGRRRVSTTVSLVDYVNAHAGPGATLYANLDAFSIEAILDDHEQSGPHHGDHRVTLNLTKTPGCLRWLGAHASYFGQEEFAQLIEDGLTEIARPDGATLLEVAQSIRATKSANFRSDRRLTSGRVQFAWVEELNATAGADGNLEIPETVTLVFEPFYGAEPVQIDARFRYRIRDGKLSLGFWLIRHEETLREAFEAELERVKGTLNVDALLLSGSSS